MRISLMLALQLVAAPALAQGYIGGYAIDSASSVPLPCIDVALIDTTGRIMARQLTSSEGMFQLDAPPRGTYRLRFGIWHHEPLIGPAEELEPGMERARRYSLSFRATTPTWAKWSPGDTVGDRPPLPRRSPRAPLRYPDHLRINGVEGEVSLNFLVDSTGRVVPPTIDVVRSTHHEFATAVLRFLREAEFEPARVDGRASCAQMRNMPFTFSLQRRPTRPPQGKPLPP